MRTTFARDRFDFRCPLREARRERPGKPLKLRLQPTILRRQAKARTTFYRAWQGVCWSIELADVKEGVALCEALAAFFAALNTRSPEQLTALLRQPAQPAPVTGHHGNQEVPA